MWKSFLTISEISGNIFSAVLSRLIGLDANLDVVLTSSGDSSGRARLLSLFITSRLFRLSEILFNDDYKLIDLESAERLMIVELRS